MSSFTIFMNIKIINLDFDYWMQFYQENPDEFELKRKEVVERYISDAQYSERKMKGLQFKIDMDRRKSRTAMGACIRVSDLMKTYFRNEFTPAVNSFCFHEKK